MSMGSGGMYGNPFAVGPQGPIGIEPTQFNMPAQKPKGGMFGGGGDWKQALAAALSAMSAARGNPVGMAGIQMLNQRLGQKREDEQYEQRRQAELQDYGKKLEMQAQFKGPDLTSYAQDLIAAGHQPGSPQFQALYDRYVQQKAQNGGSPFAGMFTNPVDGQQYMRPNLPPLGQEMDDPRMQGGPSPQGSGGFPGSY